MRAATAGLRERCFYGAMRLGYPFLGESSPGWHCLSLLFRATRLAKKAVEILALDLDASLLRRHTRRMSNIDKQQIDRRFGMNAWAFAAVVGLLMALSITNMARGLAEREAETTISR
jgi:hypothetical protein